MSPSLVYLGIRVRYCGLGLKGLDECVAYFIWVKERSWNQSISYDYKLSNFIPVHTCPCSNIGLIFACILL